MFSSKTVWYLPFAILTITFLLYASIGLWFNQWIMNGYSVRPPNVLDGVLSPETLDALYDDARLHGALLSLTEAVAKASSDYGNTYNSDGLKDFGKNLTGEVERIKAASASTKRTNRQGLFGSVENKLSARQGGLLGGLLGGGGSNSTGGLGDLFGQALSGLGGDLAGSLATPAFFLGIGVGMGAETGLNLTNENQAKEIATKVASSMGMEPTGLNLVAQNLGSGLSAQLAPALGNVGSDVPIGMVVYALAQGIGEGSASGLNLTQEKFEPKNSSDIMSVAGNFGLGIAGPIAGGIGNSQFFSQASTTSGQLMAQIPQIAMAAGQGLGEGASKGLGLSKSANSTVVSPLGKRQVPTDPNEIDLEGTVRNFTYGLSESFLQSADLSKVFDPGSLNLNLDATGIISYASGAGKGLGEGLAIGLNLTAAVGGTVTSPEVGGTGINSTQEQIAEQFVKGLSAALLQNGGASFVGNAVNSGGGFTKNLDASKVAEGAARGLVEGAVHGLSQAGGLKKVLSGNFSKDLPMNIPSLPPTPFNDSVNGSAVSFMRGLSGEGLLLISQYMNQGKNASIPYSRLTRRADNLALAVDSQTLQSLAQSGVNTLTCAGVGGLAAVGLGLRDSPALKMTMGGGSQPFDNSTLAALPKGPITITSEGNTFVINIIQGSFTINGRSLVPFAVITGLHILFTTLAFFFALPIYLVLGSVMRISVMINLPFNEAKNKKWRTIILLYIFTPLAFAGIILGFVGMGNSKHMRTTHGVIGLIVLIITIPTIVVSLFRLRTTVPQPGPPAFINIKGVPALLKGPQKIHLYSGILVQNALGLGMFAWIQGWNDLRSISLCVVDAVLTANAVVGLTNLLLLLQISATAIFGLRHYLETRIAKMEKLEEKEPGAPGTVVDYGAEKLPGVHTNVKRSDTMKTFGFDNRPSPLPATRQTAELLGREDSQIGWPSQVRKFGEEDTLPVRDTSPNPFQTTMAQPIALVSPRVYNPKLGGFEDDQSPMFPPTKTEGQAREQVDERGDSFGDFRPSSEVDPESRFVSYAVPLQPQTQGEEGKMPGGHIRRNESFSRPFEGRPSGESMRERYEEVRREMIQEEGRFDIRQDVQEREMVGGYGGFRQ
ncbi:hypothetical protein K458DRAFT_436943 [Lentithecium fluviatile CBS 122367]|uniref:Cytochrome b561 domain-containing protein n=1 Tax=Lentithecium fluviatile CBS 122367 TaxID=1168545 RepID=A0A6G1IFL0_9PLEO|nr:hypothetical protein K458DRAFT_436943 [Lentithecium fluviatile CBS 122367]